MNRYPGLELKKMFSFHITFRLACSTFHNESINHLFMDFFHRKLTFNLDREKVLFNETYAREVSTSFQVSREKSDFKIFTKIFALVSHETR